MIPNHCEQPYFVAKRFMLINFFIMDTFKFKSINNYYFDVMFSTDRIDQIEIIFHKLKTTSK